MTSQLILQMIEDVVIEMANHHASRHHASTASSFFPSAAEAEPTSEPRSFRECGGWGGTLVALGEK